MLYLYWKFVPFIYIFLYVRTSPYSRSTSVLGFLPPPLGFLPNLQNPFHQARDMGRGRSSVSPSDCGRPTLLKGRDVPLPSLERPSHTTGSHSPLRNTIAGVVAGGETLLFGVCLLLLLKLILSDGPQFLSTKRPFNVPLPPAKLPFAPLSPAWQLRPCVTSSPGLPLRCAQGLETGSLCAPWTSGGASV